ncbi:neuronal acetylcholine receptor subunit beta-2-like isoform X2 [Tubulanus polymorphus]|uniref:neuronal acetylcholine receptor subunit beta-2-like isoform X2 n=1 Tax=Tubulanus polymorphus TaxID=672921 RepID=UPI003DA54F48
MLSILMRQIWTVVLIITASAAKDTVYYNEQHRLIDNILKDYKSSIAPTKDPAGVIDIWINHEPTRILWTAVGEGYTYMKFWIDLEWKDERLKWDEKNFTGVEKVLIDPGKLWKPDIVSYSVDDGIQNVRFRSALAVSSDGTLRYSDSYNMWFMCDKEINHFPYDSQVCPIKLISREQQLSYRLTRRSRKKRLENQDFPEWSLESSKPKVGYFLRQRPDDVAYTDISYDITLKRNPTFYVATLVVPGTLLSIVIPFIFLISGETNEKSYIGSAVTIGYLLLLVITDAIFPLSSGNPPNLIVMFSANIVITLVVLIISVFLDYICILEGTRTAPQFFDKTTSFVVRCRRFWKTIAHRAPTASDSYQ